jgi:hypothetical protein
MLLEHLTADLKGQKELFTGGVARSFDLAFTAEQAHFASTC